MKNVFALSKEKVKRLNTAKNFFDKECIDISLAHLPLEEQKRVQWAFITAAMVLLKGSDWEWAEFYAQDKVWGGVEWNEK